VTFPEARRRGVAFEVLTAVFETLRGMGKRRLFAHVMSTNTAVIGLYEKSGWQVVWHNEWLAPVLGPLFGTKGVVRIRKDLAQDADRASEA
jgi:ribosomal protein S18 acetylase RimI-like enzyme